MLDTDRYRVEVPPEPFTNQPRVVRPPLSLLTYWLLHGYGVHFFTCWDGNRTRLHPSNGPCEKCEDSRPPRFNSAHYCKCAGESFVSVVLLPESASRQLHDLHMDNRVSEGTVITTHRAGRSNQAKVTVDVVGHKEPGPGVFDPEARERLWQHVAILLDS